MKYFLYIAAALLLGGCASTSVMRVQACNSTPKGVRVQVAAAHQVLAILPAAEGSVVFRATEMMLPSREEYYDLNFEGGLFKSSKLALQVNPNGTVKSYHFEAVDTGAASASSLAAAASDVTAKKLEVEKSKEKPVPTYPLDVENAQLQREILNSMLRANQNAIENGTALPFPDL